MRREPKEFIGHMLLVAVEEKVRNHKITRD